MEFNDLLNRGKLSPEGVLVFRHRPKEPKLRDVLPWLVEENHRLFNAYQQTQGPIVEKAMQSASYVAAFIGHEPGKALFVGLYKVGKTKPMSYQQFWSNRANAELHNKYGLTGMEDKKGACLWFDLVRTDFRAGWRGKLTVRWPGKELSWWRWATRNTFEILSIAEESLFVQKMPPWDQVKLSWAQLQVLPRSWRDELSRWRGIYFICDSSDGKGYVGAAYGADNIFGRWLNYAKSGHGGNTKLKKRNPKDFQFSVLQILPHDMAKDDVCHAETTWKERLHTREYGLNDN